MISVPRLFGRKHGKSNQSILKEINPEYSLEGLMLKLKHQSFGHLIWRTDSLEKTLMLRKIESRRRGWTEDEMIGWDHQLDGHEFEQVLGFGDRQESLACCVHGITESQTWVSNWTELKIGKFTKQKAEQWLPTAAAAAKSLQLCPTLCNPIDGSPLGSLNPGIL